MVTKRLLKQPAQGANIGAIACGLVPTLVHLLRDGVTLAQFLHEFSSSVQALDRCLEAPTIEVSGGYSARASRILRSRKWATVTGSRALPITAPILP